MIHRLIKGKGSLSTFEEQRQSLQIDQSWSESVLSYMSQPLVALDTPIDELEFLALDFETTGLNAHQDKVLSIGMVSFTLDQIDIASSEELFIDNGDYIKPETAEINGLTPQALAHGITLDMGIDCLLEKAKGKVVLAHGANIEKAFIEAFLAQRYQIGVFPAYFIDTIYIEKRFSYAGKTGTHKSYQLNDMRRHYKLPNYLEHSAASDAFACAELFLAQFKKLKLRYIKGMGLKKLQS